MSFNGSLKSLASADSSTRLMICSAQSCGCKCLSRMRSLFSTSTKLGSEGLVQCDACPPFHCRVCFEQVKRAYACTLATTWNSHCCIIVCGMLKDSRHVVYRKAAHQTHHKFLHTCDNCLWRHDGYNVVISPVPELFTKTGIPSAFLDGLVATIHVLFLRI
jgi:hypothetical protein